MIVFQFLSRKMDNLKVTFQQYPLQITALLSLLLSLVAILGQAIIGKDATLYLHVAQQVSENGFSIAFKTFNWPWFSILIAYTHKVFGLSYEFIAYSYSVLFAMGISVLLVSITRKLEPKATWWAVLLALSVPAFNTFRYDIIRDTGSWFFLVLSLWLLLTTDKLTWLRGTLFQLAVVAAVLFRLETVFIVVAVAFYYAFFAQNLNIRERLICLIQCNFLFLMGAMLLLSFAAWNDLLSQQRIAHFLKLVDPTVMHKALMVKADKFSKIALAKWAYDDAPLIIVFGMAATLLYHQFQYGFLVSILLLFKRGRSAFASACCRFRLLTIAALLFYLVLLVFFVQRGFENSRYGTPLILLLLPLLSIMAARVFEHKSKWSMVFIALSCVLALSNVTHTSPSKKHYLEAADWVKTNVDNPARLYTFDERISYYADRGYATKWKREFEKMNKNHIKAYDYFVVRDSAKKNIVLENAERLGLKEITHFSNGKTTIYVLTHK